MIYLDESGDLGFGPRASKYFILAAIITRDPEHVRGCIKRVRQQKLPKKYKTIPELKFHNSSQTIRTRILDCTARTDTDVAYAVLRKDQVYDQLRNKQSILYNYISGSLIAKIITAYNLERSIKVFVDRSLYGLERDNFDNYLSWKACIGNHSEELSINPPEIEHIDSRQDRCIQAVDFVAGAIGHRYSTNDASYYKKIESRISIVMDFFEGKDKNCVVNPSLLRPIRLRAASSFSGRTYNTTQDNMHIG
ncbi:MAG: hypothetical protein A4E48_01083 [Methanosaeta sp. PtaU1.Bin060]|nr:DUF3800 domain-containing protein [Methanothrix sp.]OPY52587.1 MAG: hypothetical protein A4E48_01083 [Methanosaeta sp. PtaU1.Bin060]